MLHTEMTVWNTQGKEILLYSAYNRKSKERKFKLLFKQVSFQLLLSSLSEPIILTLDMTSIFRGFLFLFYYFFLPCIECRTATLKRVKNKLKYTGKGDLLNLKISSYFVIPRHIKTQKDFTSSEVFWTCICPLQ